VPSVLDYKSLGTGFDARTEVYLSFLSFTCVSRVILTLITIINFLIVISNCMLYEEKDMYKSHEDLLYAA